jgi:hypothetical protein
VRGAITANSALDSNEQGLRLDDEVLAQLRTEMARAHPTVRGTVKLGLNVSPEGIVLAAELQGGSIAAVVGLDVIRRIVGKRLFLGSSTTQARMRLIVAI